MNDEDAIRRTMDILQRGGWLKHVYALGNAHCLVGAMSSASCPPSTYELVALCLPEYKYHQAGVAILAQANLVAFNDAPSTHVEDIFGILEAALERAILGFPPRSSPTWLLGPSVLSAPSMVVTTGAAQPALATKPRGCRCEDIASVYTVLGECAGLVFDPNSQDQHLGNWNDVPGRSFDDVKTVVSCAKEKLRSGAA